MIILRRLRVCFLFSVLLAIAAAPAGAQTELIEGYVQSLRSLYKQPDASSETIGLLRPGDFIRVEHVHSLVYRVFRNGESEAVGYVVYPKLGSESPIGATPVREASRASRGETGDGPPANPKAGDPRKMWVHAFVNIRSGPSTRESVVAQLPPGTAVMVSGRKGRWHLVYKSTETVFDESHALGFVHESLLRATEPPREANPLSISDLDVSADPAVASDRQPSAASRSGSAVDINTANQAELESLPRIGPVLAARILEYRDQNGPFKRIEDLVRVKGIGDKTLERLRPYVVID
jgi:competence protein ComEA